MKTGKELKIFSIMFFIGIIVTAVGFCLFKLWLGLVFIGISISAFSLIAVRGKVQEEEKTENDEAFKALLSEIKALEKTNKPNGFNPFNMNPSDN